MDDDTVECAFATSKLLILAVISIEVTILMALPSFWSLNYCESFQNTMTSEEKPINGLR